MSSVGGCQVYDGETIEVHLVRAEQIADLEATPRCLPRLLARYQPEGGFRLVSPDDPLHRGALDQLAAVKLARPSGEARGGTVNVLVSDCSTDFGDGATYQSTRLEVRPAR